MCGRYAASKATDDLVEELEVDADRTAEPVRSVLVNPQNPPAGSPDWNIAPGKNTRVVLTRSTRDAQGNDTGELERSLRLLTWGLVPPWAKDVRTGMKMTNARVETVLEKPSFRKAAHSRRCLVPADGWYEWQVSPTAVDAKGKPRKQPFFTYRADGASLTFGGLYEFWRDPHGEPGDPLAWLATFTIITTAAEPGLDRIHDRAPLVVDPSDWAAWLDPSLDETADVLRLLQPAPPGRFAAYPVDRAVGSMRNNGPHLLRPVGPEQLEGVVDPATGEILGSGAAG